MAMEKERMNMFEFLPLNIDIYRDVITEFRIDSFVVSFGHARMLTEGSGIEDYLKILRSRSDLLPGSCVHVFHGPKIVGQIESRVKETADQRKEGYVNLYYLIPEYRNLGFGYHLDEYITRFYAHHGLSNVSLNVSQTNLRAIKFYEKMGYSIIEKVDKSGEKIHVMSKDISNQLI